MTATKIVRYMYMLTVHVIVTQGIVSMKTVIIQPQGRARQRSTASKLQIGRSWHAVLCVLYIAQG
jgi:hypothetical protein